METVGELCHENIGFILDLVAKLVEQLLFLCYSSQLLLLSTLNVVVSVPPLGKVDLM
jgi:hypothetical protein